MFGGQGGREKRSVAEARFTPHAVPGGWRLVVEDEAYLDSPLFEFAAESSADLSTLDLLGLRVETPRPGQRWRLERGALHPDGLEWLTVSRGPIRSAAAVTPTQGEPR